MLFNWSCEGDKSLGFNLKFIKESWEILNYDFVDFFKEFHAKASLPKAFSASIITLFLKIITE